VTPVTTALVHRSAKYFIIFTPKWFVLAVATVSTELTAIFAEQICKILQFLHFFVNSAHDGQLCMRGIAEF